MNRLDANEWLVVNNLIYKIYTTENLDEMRKNTLEQLKMILDFDAATFWLVDQEERKLVSPIVLNCDTLFLEKYDISEYHKKIIFKGIGLVYRDTDIITDIRRVRTDFYKMIYATYNWHYALHMTIAMDNQSIGWLSLYRTIGKDNFSYDEIQLVELFREHITYRLYRNAFHIKDDRNKITVDAAAERFLLTKRELTVLEYLITDGSYEDICTKLAISINTLKKHILNIYRKIGIKNRRQLYNLISNKE